MRRLQFFLFLFLIPFPLFALYNGNPSLPMMPETGTFIPRNMWIGVKAGYQFDRVYDRKLHFAGPGSHHLRKTVQEYDSLSNLGIVTVNFNDRVEIFTSLGAIWAHLSQHPLSDTKVTYRTHSSFAWGAGARAIVAYWGDLQLSLNAAYLSSNMPLSSLSAGGKSYSTTHSHFNFREWQVGSGISYRVRWFIPYFGIDFSDLHVRIERLNALAFLFPKKHVTFKESHPLGIFLGFGISPDRTIALNFEARVINENAFTLAADFKF